MYTWQSPFKLTTVGSKEAEVLYAVRTCTMGKPKKDRFAENELDLAIRLCCDHAFYKQTVTDYQKTHRLDPPAGWTHCAEAYGAWC